MILCVRILNLFLLLLATLIAIDNINAFVISPSQKTQQKQCKVQYPKEYHHFTNSYTASSSSLLMSDDDDDDDDVADELSKLLGKRNQIRRKEVEDDVKEDVSLIDTVSIDFDNVPEFKSQRPLRSETSSKSKKDEVDDNDPSKGRGGGEDELSYIDFYADYEHENEFQIPNRIGISTVGWGDEKYGFVIQNKKKKKTKKLSKKQQKAGKYVAGDIQMAFNLCMEAGICLVETSPKYGINNKSKKLSAEQILSECLDQYDGNSNPLVIENLGMSLLPRPGPMIKSMEDSCSTLGLSNVESIQVKKMLPSMLGLLPNSLADVVEDGTCNYASVEGVKSKRALSTMQNKLEDKGVLLASNAFEYSLTNNKLEYMIQACKDVGVVPLIRNPLDNGLATGIYTATNPSGSGVSMMNKEFPFKTLEQLRPLHNMQEKVAERVRTRLLKEKNTLKDNYRYGPKPKLNTDITTTQVAINYVVAKGGVPIVEINSPRQAEELLGCLGWSLNKEEVKLLDKMRK